jgi:hypothetical protein
MAPRRKKIEGLRPAGAAAPRPGREYKLRLPEDIAERIEKKAVAEQRPQNRVIINELASVPYLEQFKNLAEQVTNMEIILARHGARITWHDIQDELLNAVDAVLGQPTNAPAALDKLRAVRAGMLIHERMMKKKKGELQGSRN